MPRVKNAIIIIRCCIAQSALDANTINYILHTTASSPVSKTKRQKYIFSHHILCAIQAVHVFWPKQLNVILHEFQCFVAETHNNNNTRKKTCLNWNNARKTRLLFAWRIAPVNTHLYNSIAYKIISLASHRRLRQIRCRCGDRG